jgi:hypothetical protein
MDLNLEQIELLFDYHLGEVSEEQKQQAGKLLSDNQDAQTFLTTLNGNRQLVRSYTITEVPDDLVEKTLERIHARQPQVRFKPPSEQTPPRFIFKPRELLAMAAGILILFAVLVPKLHHVRQVASEYQCASTLRGLGMGFLSYGRDHGNHLPYVPNQPGAPWWKIGNDSSENTSNTRNVFLLVRGGYVDLGDFLCPAVELERKIPDRHDPVWNDFPARHLIHFSFQNMFGPKRPTLNHNPQMVILADRNPYVKPGKMPIRIVDQKNSPNHNSRGQNVLHIGGHVKWFTVSIVRRNDCMWRGASRELTGHEVPESIDDVFLVP